MFGIHSRGPSASALLLALAAAGWLGGCHGGQSATPDAAVDALPASDAPAADARPSIDAFRADASEPPTGATCGAPFVLAPGDSHSSDTTDLFDDLAGACSPGSGLAPDSVYSVEMGETARDLTVEVTVDEDAESPFDVVLYARTDCTDAESAIGCSAVGWGERLELLEVSGAVTVVVDGTDQFGGARAGAYSLTTAARDIAAQGAPCDPFASTSRCAAGNRCVSSVCVEDSAALACSLAGANPTDVVATTFGFESDFYSGSCAYDSDASFPEHLYRLDLAATSDVVATTDFAETDFDTYLYLRDGTDGCDGAEVGCDDDVDTEHQNLKSTLSVSGLAAGTYYLFVDGSSASPGTGTYRLQVTISPAS